MKQKHIKEWFEPVKIPFCTQSHSSPYSNSTNKVVLCQLKYLIFMNSHTV